jgi:hypothetical protein
MSTCAATRNACASPGERQRPEPPAGRIQGALRGRRDHPHRRGPVGSPPGRGPGQPVLGPGHPGRQPRGLRRRGRPEPDRPGPRAVPGRPAAHQRRAGLRPGRQEQSRRSRPRATRSRPPPPASRSPRPAYRPTVSARAGLGWDAEPQSTARAASSATTTAPDRFDHRLGADLHRRPDQLAGARRQERENAARIAVEGAQRSALQQISTAWNNLLASRANLVSNEEQVRATKHRLRGRAPGAAGRPAHHPGRAERPAGAGQRRGRPGGGPPRRIRGQRQRPAGHGRAERRQPGPDVERYDPVKSYDKVNHAFGWVPWEPVVQGIDKVGAPSTSGQGRARGWRRQVGRNGAPASLSLLKARKSAPSRKRPPGRLQDSYPFETARTCPTRAPKNRRWRRSSPPSGASSRKMTRRRRRPLRRPNRNRKPSSWPKRRRPRTTSWS